MISNHPLPMIGRLPCLEYSPQVPPSSNTSGKDKSCKRRRVQNPRKNDEPPIRTIVGFQYGPCYRYPRQSAEAGDEKSCSVPFPVVFDLADLADADWREADGCSGPEAEEDGEGCCSDFFAVGS